MVQLLVLHIERSVLDVSYHGTAQLLVLRIGQSALDVS
jgi:hypothetical protein